MPPRPHLQNVDYFMRFIDLQIRRVDPTLDMEADEGDDYTHLPVHQMTSDFTNPFAMNVKAASDLLFS